MVLNVTSQTPAPSDLSEYPGLFRKLDFAYRGGLHPVSPASAARMRSLRIVALQERGVPVSRAGWPTHFMRAPKLRVPALPAQALSAAVRGARDPGGVDHARLRQVLYSPVRAVQPWLGLSLPRTLAAMIALHAGEQSDRRTPGPRSARRAAALPYHLRRTGPHCGSRDLLRPRAGRQRTNVAARGQEGRRSPGEGACAGSRSTPARGRAADRGGRLQNGAGVSCTPSPP